MKLHLIDSSAEVASALQSAFSGYPEVVVQHGDLLAKAEHCVASPATSYGSMDRVLMEFFGAAISPAFRRLSPAVQRVCCPSVPVCWSERGIRASRISSSRRR